MELRLVFQVISGVMILLGLIVFFLNIVSNFFVALMGVLWAVWFGYMGWRFHFRRGN